MSANSGHLQQFFTKKDGLKQNSRMMLSQQKKMSSRSPSEEESVELSELSAYPGSKELAGVKSRGNGTGMSEPILTTPISNASK